MLQRLAFLILVIPLCGCLAPCGRAPAAPKLHDVATDWGEVVRPNCLANQLRLGRWVGGGNPLLPTENPGQYFLPLSTEKLIGAGGKAVDVRVLVHGWAPGYLDAVKAADREILWWSSNASAGGEWAANWAWIQGKKDAFDITATGLFQQIQLENPQSVVLGYSWLDDSATPPVTNLSNLALTKVYQSEAHTNANGIRLATAIDQVLAPEFWANPANRLHIIGHSHGSKVAAVAALLLQQRHAGAAKGGADHLTILDSPESTVTLEGNGANLIGYYLRDLRVTQNYVNPAPSSILVDSVVSYFGAAYVEAGTKLDNVVNVLIYPWTISISPEFSHSYAAEWYAGARAGSFALGLPLVGLAWPPVPSGYQPTSAQPFLNQSWYPSGQKTQANQWTLRRTDASNAARLVYKFGTSPLTVIDRGGNTGSVRLVHNMLRMSTTQSGQPTLARFRGAYDNPVFSDNYGVGFDLTWTNPQDGDYLVITVDSPEESWLDGAQETILVIDGKSLGGKDLSKFPVSFNADVSSGPVHNVQFYVYLVPAAGNTASFVVMQNFEFISSSSD